MTLFLVAYNSCYTLLSELTHGDEPIPLSCHRKLVVEPGLATPSLDSHLHTASLAAGIAALRKCQGLSDLAWGASEIYLYGLIDSE